MEAPKAIKIYKILLDIAWYFIMFFIGSLILLNLVSTIKFGILKFNFNINLIEVEMPKTDFSKFKNTYNFVLEQPEKVFLEISNINLSSLTDPFIIFYLLFGLISFLLSVFQLKLLRNLIKDVIGSKIFTRENVKRLKTIGYLELLSAATYLCYHFVMWALINNYKILDPALTYAPEYFEVLEFLPRALEYLIFAGIFSFGLKLKQEQDLTI